MKLQVTVSQIMTADPIYAEPDNTFSQARDLFMKFKLHHLPVIENGSIKGIISILDIAKAYTVAGKNRWPADDDSMNSKFPLTDVMTENPVNVSPTTSVEQTIKVFQKNFFQALPVVEKGKLVGIITLKDIVLHIKE